MLYKGRTIETTKCSKNLNRILGVVNALSESEKTKGEDNVIKDTNNLFRLRKS